MDSKRSHKYINYILLVIIIVITACAIKFTQQYLQNETKANEIALQAKNDSINNVKDSLFLAKIAKEEGNHIFGDFYFGMSKKDFDATYQKLMEETEGFIRVDSLSFFVDNVEETKFYKDSLCRIRLVSEARFTPPTSNLNDYCDYYNQYVDTLKNYFIRKYGEHYDYMPHKNIYVSQGFYDHKWHFYIDLSHPKLIRKFEHQEVVEIEAKEKKEAKEKELRIQAFKQKEAEKNRKRDKMGEGL